MNMFSMFAEEAFNGDIWNGMSLPSPTWPCMFERATAFNGDTKWMSLCHHAGVPEAAAFNGDISC
jgi:hypothetical protein